MFPSIYARDKSPKIEKNSVSQPLLIRGIPSLIKGQLKFLKAKPLRNTPLHQESQYKKTS
jgi:hypothetical protein